MNTRRVVAVDLDGTYVQGNTLHMYLRTALAMRATGWRKRLGIACWMALRVLRLVSHRSMKFNCLGLIAPTPALRKAFVERVRTAVNPAVGALVGDERARGALVVLATAAPDVYVPWIWQGPFVATPVADNAGRAEMRGQAKVKALECLAPDGPDLAVTDHHDDLPLMHRAKATLLVNPSARTLTAARMAGINFTLL